MDLRPFVPKMTLSFKDFRLSLFLDTGSGPGVVFSKRSSRFLCADNREKEKV